MTSPTNNRLDYLDAVRSFALILGIIFHASLAYMPIFIGWAVMDISTSSVVPFFALVSHSFRMELFFLVAGFFSHMTLHKKGWQRFLQSRLVRIAIPFILGWLLLRPMLVSGWIMGAESMRGEANIAGALLQGITTVLSTPADFLVGTHLWFLYYLLVISVSVVVLRNLLGLYQPLKKVLADYSDRTVAGLCQSPFTIWVLAIPTACCLWFMDRWGMDTPDKSLIPTMPVVLIYAGCFLFGWLLHRQTALMEQFSQLSWGKSLLCSSAIIASVMLSGFEPHTGHPYYNLIKAGFMFSYGLMMWSLISLSIGLCRQVCARPNNVIRYMADASYWLYLIHLPIVVWLQVAFAELPLHWSVKLFSISTITIALSLVIYDAVIRPTFVGAILNGQRKPRMLFKRRQVIECHAGG